MAYKRKRILAVIIIINIVLISLIVIIKKKNKSEITYAQAGKLFAYTIADTNTLNSAEKDNLGYWYKPYIEIINDKLGIQIKSPSKNITWQFVYKVYQAVKETYPELQSQTENSQQENDILNKLQAKSTSKKHINASEFYQVYNVIKKYMPYGEEINEVEAGIAGTPLMLSAAGEWEVYTTNGKYRFSGIILDDKIDKTVSMFVRNNEILSVIKVVSSNVEYKNIWVKSCNENVLETNIYGADRTFSIKGTTQSVTGVLADISLSNGKIKNINIKTDEIGGKVLSVTKDYVEIEGYGKVPLDKDFMIYDINNGFSVKTYEDIIVGYSLQNFIVAQGSICGAVISKPLNADNIRVIVKTTGFNNIFHENVVINCNSPYIIHLANEDIECAAGQETVVGRDNPAFSEGRMTIIAQNNDEIMINSITRSQGTPSYKGTLELSLYEQGIVVVNEIDIESYLKRVVPSEMPVSFGVEALKVQAVCARSYAYKQLTNSYYSEYGAHVDDSTLFQVYNNTTESEASNQAISATNCMVLKYNSEVVQTYYYSTSCGVTTDVGLWGSSPENYPYFSSIAVSRDKKNLNLCDENTFEQFITSKNENDYDYTFALYRWELNVTTEQLSKSFNSKLYDRYIAVPEKILTQNADGTFSSKKITTVGNIQDIIVNSRANGGAITSLTVIGDTAVVRIDSEPCIRVLLGVDTVDMTTNTGTTVMSSLPSTFCIFKKVYNQDVYTGFKIIGGGYGHGIGMSQNAVSVMAAEGMNYVQILQFFYPNTEVGTK